MHVHSFVCASGALAADASLGPGPQVCQAVSVACMRTCSSCLTCVDTATGTLIQLAPRTLGGAFLLELARAMSCPGRAEQCNLMPALICSTCTLVWRMYMMLHILLPPGWFAVGPWPPTTLVTISPTWARLAFRLHFAHNMVLREKAAQGDS